MQMENKNTVPNSNSHIVSCHFINSPLWPPSSERGCPPDPDSLPLDEAFEDTQDNECCSMANNVSGPLDFRYMELTATSTPSSGLIRPPIRVVFTGEVETNLKNVPVKVLVMDSPVVNAEETTGGESPPFITEGYAFPSGLNRKERRRIIFQGEKNPSSYPGAIKVSQSHVPANQYTVTDNSAVGCPTGPTYHAASESASEYPVAKPHYFITQQEYLELKKKQLRS
eukprot:GILI01027947.1.p1 GENE.GILI01027947.1~~GILI01027947.1.p1  ORF type:complete len:226 (-),score=11.74 GILI01027947.1:144-821(-)